MADNNNFIIFEVIPHNKHIIIKYNGYKETYIGYTKREAISKYREWYNKEISPDDGVNKAKVLTL